MKKIKDGLMRGWWDLLLRVNMCQWLSDLSRWISFNKPPQESPGLYNEICFFIIQSAGCVEIPSKYCLSVWSKSCRQSSDPWRCVDQASSCFPVADHRDSPMVASVPTILHSTTKHYGLEPAPLICNRRIRMLQYPPTTPRENFSQQFKPNETLYVVTQPWLIEHLL